MQYCSHSNYSDGHCAEINCWNYYSKCPKHAYSGRTNEECSHITKAEEWKNIPKPIRK